MFLFEENVTLSLPMPVYNEIRKVKTFLGFCMVAGCSLFKDKEGFCFPVSFFMANSPSDQL